MHMLQSLFYLTIALHVSGIIKPGLSLACLLDITPWGDIYISWGYVMTPCAGNVLLRRKLSIQFYSILFCSSGIITYLQEHKTTVTTASGNRYTVLLSAAIVEKLELVWVCCGWRTPKKKPGDWCKGWDFEMAPVWEWAGILAIQMFSSVTLAIVSVIPQSMFQ
jgi:hypothetical protein